MFFYEYSKTWKLSINFPKKKKKKKEKKKENIMIFETQNDDNFKFKLSENVISICKDFKYLGVIIFFEKPTFLLSYETQFSQAKKVMHLLYKRMGNINIPTDLQLKLFDQTIAPILLYGCEVQGFQNTQLIENVHNEFLRHIFKVRAL